MYTYEFTREGLPSIYIKISCRNWSIVRGLYADYRRNDDDLDLAEYDFVNYLRDQRYMAEWLDLTPHAILEWE